MNYSVEVYRTTKKGHTETLLQFVVNSQNSMYAIQNYLSKQYKGFNISIKEVETINIDIDNEESQTQTTIKPVKASYKSYDGYYVDKTIPEKDLSPEDKAEWESLNSKYLSLCKNIQQKYIEKNETAEFITQIKRFSIYRIGLPKVQIYLTSDFMREF